MNVVKRTFICLSILVFFAGCKREVLQEDLVKSNIPFKVLNQQTGAPYLLFERKAGGYILVVSDVIGGGIREDYKVIILDQEMQTVSQNTYGGNKDENIWKGVMDDDGYLYICGFTNSTDLRMDKYTDQTDSYDGYLAKIDPDGGLVWHFGYSDTTSPFEGYLGESLDKVYIKDNKLHVVAYTQSYAPSPFVQHVDLWMVSFDKDGNLLNDRLIPSYNPEQGFTSGVLNRSSCQLDNGDIVMGTCNLELFREGARTYDTTATLNRYDPTTDSVLWTRYYKAGTPEGDFMHLGQLHNGDVLAYTSDFRTGIRIDQHSGDVIETWETGVSDGTEGDFYISADYSSIYPVGDALYIVGAVDREIGLPKTSAGIVLNNPRPWIMKLDGNGRTIFSKDYPVDKGYFYKVLARGDDLVYLGGLHAFGSKKFATLLYTSDADGNFVKP